VVLANSNIIGSIYSKGCLYFLEVVSFFPDIESFTAALKWGIIPLWAAWTLLHQNNCIDFFTTLFELGFPYPVQAVDALALWLDNDPKVSEELSQTTNIKRLVLLFKNAEKETFESIIEPFVKLASSKKIAVALIREDFTVILLSSWSRGNANARVNMVKLLNLLFTHTKKQKQFIIKYNLHDVLNKLTSDTSVLVAEMAARLNQVISSLKKDW